MKNWVRLIENHSPDYIYVTRCSDGGHGPMGEAINDMVDREQSISYEAFMSCVGIDQMREIFSGYDWGGEDEERHGVTMKGDYTMQDAFYRSTWYGLDCVFCVWSAIEFIFTRNGVTPETEGINRRAYLDQLIEDEYGSTEYFHVTPLANVEAIMSEGLKPMVGDRSKKLNEPEGIFLFKEQDAAEDAVGGWLGNEFGDEVTLALLQIDLPPDIDTKETSAGFEVVVNEVIPPYCIDVIDEDF